MAEAVGVDPSPVFVAKAGELAAELGNISFEEGDGRALPSADGDFDVVVRHTVLCHVPEPERVLAEACRVLRPGGILAVCDGDYATTTVLLRSVRFELRTHAATATCRPTSLSTC